MMEVLVMNGVDPRFFWFMLQGFSGGFDLQFALSVYSSVAVTYVLYVLFRRHILGEREIKELLAITLAIVKALNDGGMIRKEDMWKITESIYNKVVLGKKVAPIRLVQDLYQAICDAVVRTVEAAGFAGAAEPAEAGQPAGGGAEAPYRGG